MIQFEKIADDIRRKILIGDFKPDQILPKQEKLSDYYQVSRMTIQKALNVLKIEGFLYTKRGKGTFASHPSLQQDLYSSNVESIVGTSKQFANQGLLESKVISFEPRFPIEEEVEKLKLKKENPVYDIIRLRCLDSQPFHLEYSVMPIHVTPNITMAVLKSSIYQHITQGLGLEIGSAVRHIRADKPDEYDKKYLNCRDDDPILEIEQIAYLKDGTPFEYSQTRSRYDKASISYTSYKF